MYVAAKVSLNSIGIMEYTILYYWPKIEVDFGTMFAM